MQQPVSTGQGSSKQGGEREHMEQVCACQARLMSCRLMRVLTPGGSTLNAFCFEHTAGAQRSRELGCTAATAPKLPMQKPKRRRTYGASTCEVNRIER